jgi:hypothetical protein
MRRLRWALGAVVGAVVGVLVPAVAWAQTCTTNTSGTCTYVLPADPTGGSLGSLGSDMVSWVTNYGIPVFLSLVAVGIVLRLVVRLVKRGAVQI